MTTVTVQIEKEDDYELLLQFLKRLKIKFFPSGKISVKERQKLFSIIEKGGSGKSISDPVKWQRDIRKDRKLPDRS